MRNSLKLLFISMFLLSGCCSQMLSVHTEYLSHEQLASYRIGTPDPKLTCPTIGQRLILSWNITSKYQNLPDLHLKLRIRFRNREEVVETLYLDRFQGLYIYCLLNENFLKTNGILTYKVELFSENTLLEEWRHQIWEEAITFSSN
ncbi:hypothetical protein PHSC3_000033 [Chlamydiales bacterium STE3]|nr:hypothetical protein PHSC3_000033 [Chlamydiales bacterium STE3]